MIKKWISVLIIGAFLLCLSTSPVLGVLDEGGFCPCCTIQKILTDRQMINYKVEKGDTLWDIANKNNIDLETVMIINHLNENTILSIGQTIEIPYSRSRIHIIRKGETMWSIAARYNTLVGDIQKSNPQRNPGNLKIGDKLIIPDSTYRAGESATHVSSSRGAILSKLVFTWPLIGAITSHYGWRQSGYHHGLDIAGELGQAIKAAASGYVVFVGYKPLYGNMVILKHADGRETVYAHAQDIYVKPDQFVVKGEVLATVGLTGNTTGPHLHFEVREGQKTCDPLKHLP